MAEYPTPFWRKIAEAVGLSEASAPAAPRATTNPAVASPAVTPPAVTPPAVTPPAVTSSAVGPETAPGTEPEGAPAPDAEALLELWFARAEIDDLVWRGCVPGPSASEVATRLSLVPPSFLADGVEIIPLAEHILETEYDVRPTWRTDRQAQRVFAVVHQVGAAGSSAARRGAALVLWLWASDDLHGPLSVPVVSATPDKALAALAFRLAAVVDPADWVRDADRRDEAARQFLFWSGQLPAGEDEATARSILGMRDSLTQNAALAQTLADHEHRLEVRRRLQAARSREAAARYSNE